MKEYKSFQKNKKKKLLFNTNVKSVFLYGSETWKVTEMVTKPLQNFINRCLRRILAIWWPDRISNEDLWKKTDQLPTHIEIKKCKYFKETRWCH